MGKKEILKLAQTINLKVTGMTCEGCSARVENALKSVAGVDTVVIDLSAGKATVDAGGEGMDSARLIVAVKLAGYEARVI
jgi:Cu+-exporting ATPase